MSVAGDGQLVPLSSLEGLFEPDTKARADWLTQRKIGASDWASILGVPGAYKSRWQLAMELTGQLEPEPMEDSDDIEYGNELEPITLRQLAKRTGRDVTPWPRYQSVVSQEYSFLTATPDATQVDDERPGVGTVDAKNTNAYLMKMWRDGILRMGCKPVVAKNNNPPMIYQVQLQSQMYVMGLEWGTLCATVGGNRMCAFDCFRNDKFIAVAVKAIVEFWQQIQAGIMPSPDNSTATREALARLYPEDTGVEIELPGQFSAWHSELTILKKAESAIKARRDAIENEVKAAMGSNSIGVLPDGRQFTWKQQTRAAYSVPESTYRVLRQKSPKQAIEVTAADRIAESTTALLAAGATLIDESESGSRYFELAGGLTVRVADHAANEATDRWMGRCEVAEVRVDQDSWRDDLEVITGPNLLLEE